MNVRDIRKITIAGAGTMGYSMADRFASFGYEVTLWNHRQETLDRARGLISAEQRDNIAYTTADSALTDFDVLVESITEDLDIKLDFYRRLSELAPANAIICTNTSGLSINKLAEAVADPARFLGMHWFNPPTLIPLIEIIRNDQTSDEVAQTIYDLALAVDKKPAIVQKDVPGFAANRLQLAVLREALKLVKDGVISVEDIDAVMKYGLGFRWAALGPLETVDFGGLDTFDHIASYLMPDLADGHEIPELLDAHYKAGELGVKTGHGFYEYPGDTAVEKTAERDRKLQAIYDALYSDASETPGVSDAFDAPER